MLRNFLRTSRWLARRQIIIAPTICRHWDGNLKFSKIEKLTKRMYCSQNIQLSDVDPVIFDKVCNETLESLCEYFEELIDQSPNLKGADVTFSDGVLTIALGPNYGTYVINRQTPNKQIWLSSPTAGPKRYDLVLKEGGYWIYKHDGVTLHQLLQQEISKIATNVNFKTCTHALV
ncbi:frataxin homolog, mitochondrial [Maniola hyperantus]|uniref:frataxin homolog, mitochondrial n=1 Tax=Aphantopus hyperantus TaxID=2795564 RepID=UPI0015683426|nr:frataxin homolog, mitochondrial [Maniola hyperantus]